MTKGDLNSNSYNILSWQILRPNFRLTEHEMWPLECPQGNYWQHTMDKGHWANTKTHLEHVVLRWPKLEALERLYRSTGLIFLQWQKKFLTIIIQSLHFSSPKKKGMEKTWEKKKKMVTTLFLVFHNNFYPFLYILVRFTNLKICCLQQVLSQTILDGETSKYRKYVL